MAAWPWLVTLVLTATLSLQTPSAPRVWPTLAPQRVALRFRFADGTPASGVTAEMFQIMLPAGATTWQGHREVVVGRCQTGADGRCTLAFKLEQPVLYDPELGVTGYQFVGVGGEMGGEEAASAPAQAYSSYPLPVEAWGQTLSFVLLASNVVVGDLNPSGVPSFISPPPVESVATTLEAPWPVMPATAAAPGPGTATRVPAITPTPCPTCRPANPPAGWDLRTWSAFLIAGGLLLVGIAVYFLWKRDQQSRNS